MVANTHLLSVSVIVGSTDADEVEQRLTDALAGYGRICRFDVFPYDRRFHAALDETLSALAPANLKGMTCNLEAAIDDEVQARDEILQLVEQVRQETGHFQVLPIQMFFNPLSSPALKSRPDGLRAANRQIVRTQPAYVR